MKQLAIRLGYQNTIAKSLVIAVLTLLSSSPHPCRLVLASIANWDKRAGILPANK
jgi:hypothetical protein